jgi:hypothetical protein
VNWIRGWLRRPEPGPPRETGTAPPPAEPVAALPAVPPDPWRPLASEFALRLLTLTWEAVHYVGQAEESEPDPERRHLLFRIDHAVTRTRRLAENLRVLTGQPVEDPDQQITTLQDIAHAAGAPTEHYERLHFGPIVDLAVAAVAADDVIRILTELVDNADRYSPPTEPVNVSAHLTGDGDVLVRVEDNGIGLNPAQVPWFDHVLSGGAGADGEQLQPAHVGLPVVAALTRRHRSLRVRLSPRRPRGTVAMLLIGADLLCEVPTGAPQELPAPPRPSRHAQPGAISSGAISSGAISSGAISSGAISSGAISSGAIPSGAVSSGAGQSGSIGPARPRPAIPAQAGASSGPTMMLPVQPPAPARAAPPMPRRVPASVRGTEPPPEPVVPAVPHTTAWPEDAAAFNSGVDAARAHLSSPN